MFRSNGFVLIRFAAVVALGSIVGCSPTPSGGSGDGDPGTDTIAMPTGEAGAVTLTKTEQGQFEGQAWGQSGLGEQAPADATTGTVSVRAGQVRFPNAVQKSAVAYQRSLRRAQIIIHLASVGAAMPCDDEFVVLDFVATEGPDGMVLSEMSSARLNDAVLERVTQEDFVICVKVVANFPGTVVVSTVDFTFTDDPGDGNGNNSPNENTTNDNVADDDNENDNGSDSDNDNDNDNGDEDTETQAHAWFAQAWTDFDRNYSHFATKGIDWDAIGAEYEPRFQADLSAGEFLDEIKDLLAELHDLHVWLFDMDGQPVEVYSKAVARNYPDSYPARYFPAGLQQFQGFPLRHGFLEHNVGYMSIESFEDDLWEELDAGDVEALITPYLATDALIIDIRKTSGGDEAIGQVFASLLTATSYVYGYHRTKNPGADHEAFGDFVEHRVEPVGLVAYTNPVACLIGEMNMGSAEWFALMMLENPGGIDLIGDMTRGSSGNPRKFSLDNGIEYYIPKWEAYRADQTTKIEDVGISPTPGGAVAPEESYAGDDDFVLERALELLRQ